LFFHLCLAGVIAAATLGCKKEAPAPFMMTKKNGPKYHGETKPEPAETPDLTDPTQPTPPTTGTPQDTETPPCEGPDCADAPPEDPKTDPHTPPETPTTGCGDSICDAEAGENSGDCPADCHPDPGPGNCANACGVYNSDWTCQCEADCLNFGDCCSDYKTACPQGHCGDGDCGYNENTATCAKDCAGPYKDEYRACMEQLCAATYAACFDTSKCAGVWSCLINCGPNMGCVDGCLNSGGSSAKQNLLNVLECSQAAGCFSEGGGKDPICGNQKCEAGEFPSTCPGDCKTPGADSCKNRCGEFKVNATCQCDGSCSKFDECCDDYKTVCD